MSWYKSGSVNIEQGSKIITGIDTKWANPLIGVCSGQMLILKTKNSIEICEIASVQSDTQLTLANEYNGETKAGVNYEIPTSPKVSIEALALRISEMLNYYQTQLDAWQMILTGEDAVTLTAPDGRQVTIKSQYSIANELTKLLEQSKVYAEQTSKNADIAKNASSSSNNSAASAKSSADSASSSATASRDSAQKSSNSANAASLSENNAKTAEQNAKKSAEDAKNAASSIDTTVFLKKSGANDQSINGSLNVKTLKENDVRVYSPNNKPTADDIGAIPAVKKDVNGLPIYMVGNLIDFAIKPKVAGIEPIYIVESYVNGDSWYNKYSNGFIEQSGVIIARTPNANAVCGNLINLLTPMKTGNYGVSVDKVNNGLWGDIEYAYAELYLTSFWLASYSHTTGEAWIRWTVRGY
ncbi:hypothetical protein [Gilliamella sp. CG35]|uniref:hypothetical protein n=1 Tax=Gilliamella sp. CG35 TaxID=3351507 RepID=UPI00398753B4